MIEGASQQDSTTSRHRNLTPRHTTGKPVAYKLMPTQAPLLLAAPSSSIAKRGVFATRSLWVTPHRDDGACCRGV